MTLWSEPVSSPRRALDAAAGDRVAERLGINRVGENHPAVLVTGAGGAPDHARDTAVRRLVLLRAREAGRTDGAIQGAIEAVAAEVASPHPPAPVLGIDGHALQNKGASGAVGDRATKSSGKQGTTDDGSLPQAAGRRLELAREIDALQQELRAAPKGDPACAEERVRALAVLTEKLVELQRLKAAARVQASTSDWTLLARASSTTSIASTRGCRRRAWPSRRPSRPSRGESGSSRSRTRTASSSSSFSG